jgi:hypothetical protein
MQCDKKSLLASADASNKRNLMTVGGHTDHDVDLCREDSADGKLQCLGKGQTMLTQAWQRIQAVSEHQKPLARFRAIAEALSANEQNPGGTEPKKYGETRYGSRVTMSERMINTKRIYEKLMLDQEYMSWLDRQSPETKDKVRM